MWTGRDLLLRAPVIPSPGWDREDPIYNENMPFLLLLDCFSATAIVVSVVCMGPLIYLGTLFLEGHGFISPALSSRRFLGGGGGWNLARGSNLGSCQNSKLHGFNPLFFGMDPNSLSKKMNNKNKSFLGALGGKRHDGPLPGLWVGPWPGCPPPHGSASGYHYISLVLDLT